ncbi:MAG: tryptophan 2,3-dioxygenase [Gemmatimonadetes bacterium]|nr:tryptophan 2,3-dioxygenase [Gemmatimonadota bacterium]
MSRVSPVFPNLIDRTQVSCSNEPRPIGATSDQSRAYSAAANQGAPDTEFEGQSNPYVDYSFVDLLHTLQVPRSGGYDESCFIIMGQVKELLFNALHFELFNARHQVDQDNVAEALRMLERAGRLVGYIGQSWDVLSTIRVDGFNEYRDALGRASGQLSFMYRHVEFVLGNKSDRLASAHRNMPHVYPQMRAALEAPSLYDRVIALLARRGHRLGEEALERDWTKPYQADPTVEAAWAAVYREARTGNDLYELGESLIAVDDQMSQYRWRHFVSVARIIGDKPGTGGSAGVGWLRQVTEHRFFPELWAVRTQL